MTQSFANNIDNINNNNALALVVAGLEKKVGYICKENHPLYFHSIFKKMSCTNLQNAKIFYQFLITEYENENVRFNTTLTHIKILSLFSEFLNYKDFEKIIKNDVIDFLNSSRKTELDDPCNFGFYAKQIGLTADKYEFDCNKLGTHEYQELFFCDEHYPKVKK